MGRPYCLSPKLPPPSVVAQFIAPSGLDKIKPLQELGEGGRDGGTGFPVCGLPGILPQLLLMSYHYAYQPENRKEMGMSLQEVLREFKEGVVSRLAPEDVALMDEGPEALIRSGIAGKAKKVGESAPDFTLPNPNGELVSLSDLLSRGPVVVTFYRGTW